MKFSKSFLASSLVALTLLGGMTFSTASALTYNEWRQIQLDRIQNARQRGVITRQEANQYKWRINHANNNAAFNRNWNRQYNGWYNTYWNQHPNAWRWENNGRWNRNYRNDNLQDLRDFFDRWRY